MTHITDDDVERGLRELFERQARSLPVAARDWDDTTPVATVTAIEPVRRRRTALTAIGAVAAAIALVVGVAAISSAKGGVHVAGQPGAAAPVHFATPQVTFDASALRIDANGKTFTAAGSNVSVNGDPGDARYQTLELEWREQGVPMRLYVYFAADAHEWWSTEIRTYNGSAEGDWIMYTGDRFRTPLGSAFDGDVDLQPTDGQRGHLQITKLRLQPFRPPAVCRHATAPYALSANYARIDIPTGADGFGVGAVRLLDTTTCTPVADPGKFTYAYGVVDPSVAKLSPLTELVKNGFPQIDVTAVRPGVTSLHVSARDASHAVVATLDLPITVG